MHLAYLSRTPTRKRHSCTSHTRRCRTSHTRHSHTSNTRLPNLSSGPHSSQNSLDGEVDAHQVYENQTQQLLDFMVNITSRNQSQFLSLLMGDFQSGQ